MYVRPMTQTVCLDTYWQFATERQNVYHRRLESPVGPWTNDEVLATHRFTNAYRAADRVSQYLIREVQYGDDRSQDGEEVFFRTMLFKLFNTVSTWELLEAEFGPLTWKAFDAEHADEIMHEAMARKTRLYSAAYIMPDVPKFGGGRKHSNHLRLLVKMMRDGLPAKLERAPSLKAVYEAVLDYPGLGPFLAFQYAIDLNYSTLVDHDESSFVVAGPGAVDGLSKCFSDMGGRRPEEVIRLVTEHQGYELGRLGLEFRDLFGRPLQLIDCQNLFCEISKYSRVVHPELVGSAGRTKIKQGYDHQGREPMVRPFFPPKWGINDNVPVYA